MALIRVFARAEWVKHQSVNGGADDDLARQARHGIRFACLCICKVLKAKKSCPESLSERVVKVARP